MIGWERKVQAAEAGQHPMYRPREWEQRERQAEIDKEIHVHRPQADVAAFYPATPNSELIKGIRKVIEKEVRRLDMKVQVVEKDRVNLKTKLVKSEIRQNSKCGAPDCYLDAEGQSRGHHHHAGALYEATCKLCRQTNTCTNASYIGESAYWFTPLHNYIYMMQCSVYTC